MPRLEDRNSPLLHVAQQALSRYGLGGVLPVFLDGTTNQVFRIQPGMAEGEDAAGFVLRIHGPGLQSTPAIQEELQWLLAIRRDTTLMVPTPVPARDGSLIQEIPLPGEPAPRQCVLFRWVPGDFRSNHLTPSDLRRVGAFMARLHRHAERFVASHPSPPSRRAQFGDVEAWEDPSDKMAARFSAEELAVFATAARRVRTTVRELGESRDVFGFIHADLHQWNYLFHGDEVHAIDFDDCGWGYHAYDMAVTLSYLEESAAFPALEEAFLDGYQSLRPLPRSYAESLPAFLAARILFMVPWLSSLPQPSPIPWGPQYLQSAAGRLRRYLER